jgi:hypothetical protein
MMHKNVIELDQLRRDDALRQAARQRLAQGVRPVKAFRPVYRPVVSWTGRRLVSLGYRLLLLSREWEHRANTVYN